MGKVPKIKNPVRCQPGQGCKKAESERIIEVSHSGKCFTFTLVASQQSHCSGNERKLFHICNSLHILPHADRVWGIFPGKYFKQSKHQIKEMVSKSVNREVKGKVEKFDGIITEDGSEAVLIRFK